MKPKILIATTRRWFSAARLAMAFTAEGCDVAIICPSGHPVTYINTVQRRYPFSALSPARSLQAAILESKPHLIVPTDDITVAHLRSLYKAASATPPDTANAATADAGVEDHRTADAETMAFLRTVIERSLGNPDAFSSLSSRQEFLAIAREHGIDTPETEIVCSEEQIDRWFADNFSPAVLKADGTSGGEGVRIVHTRQQARRAWRKLRAPLSLARVLKRSSLDRDMHYILPWLRRAPRTVSIQPFIQGRDSNIAVACWQGEILGAIGVEVLRTWRPNGPAVLVELCDDSRMVEAARKLVRRFGMSGLCGFDFMTDERSGKTYLIEVNARAVQTCHLRYGSPRDLVGSLASAIRGLPLPPASEARKRAIIALFPLAWQADITQQMLDSAHQDIPWEEPQLVRAGFASHKKSAYRQWTPLPQELRPVGPVEKT
jgi:glutathione synthase/RimK-type ligase-like ATP-grasp enzyme